MLILGYHIIALHGDFTIALTHQSRKSHHFKGFKDPVEQLNTWIDFVNLRKYIN